GMHPDWGLVALLTAVAVLGGWAGARLTARADTSRLQAAFTVLLLLVAGYTAWRALPALT
ncbi:MAG TPA: sulfite exporter TauE/SafE family protein, partial [Trebonia sp.]|nr:sulfite exporter TauE/SafE family protein [Trebonia sp.]